MGILIKIKLLNNSGKIPEKATLHAAGYDIFSAEDIIIEKKKSGMVSTGFSIELPDGYEAQVRPRSGLAAKSGITVLNSPGTIDADYRGEVKVILINHSDIDFKIEKGMRIAQMVISKVLDTEFVKIDELTDSARGTGGFGSTGV